MPEFVDLEGVALQEAIDNGKSVRLIFTTGFQTMAKLEDFNIEVIQCRVKGKRWLVNRSALSTIVLD